MPSVLRGGLISLAQRWSPIRKHWSGRVEGSCSIVHENHNCACPNCKGLCLVFYYDRQFENATNRSWPLIGHETKVANAGIKISIMHAYAHASPSPPFVAQT